MRRERVEVSGTDFECGKGQGEKHNGMRNPHVAGTRAVQNWRSISMNGNETVRKPCSKFKSGHASERDLAQVFLNATHRAGVDQADVGDRGVGVGDVRIVLRSSQCCSA